MFVRITLLSLLTCFTLTLLPAQSDQLALIQEVWGMEKKTMLNEYMDFSQTEANAFWPLYEAFMADKTSITDSRIATIRDYANNLGTLSDDKAKELTNAVLANDLKLAKLQKKYYKKMSKALSPTRASEFFQIERYLDTAIRSELQESIPFIGEIRALRN